MDVYRRHASTAGIWTGSFEPSPLALDSDCEVWFALPLDGDVDQVWEGLNAKLTSAGVAELRAIPALAYGVSFGDRVSVTKSAEGALVVTAIQERGAYVTFRVWLGASDDVAIWLEVVEKYAQLGCVVDAYTETLIAIAAPTERASIVRNALIQDASGSLLDWEDGSAV